VIVTDDAAGGMVDVHARRPVALGAADARLWLDPDVPYDQAEQIARTSELREDYFEWYPVSTDVNRPGRQDPALIEPIDR
jgi:putative SOS response-associated peptidase YedK